MYDPILALLALPESAQHLLAGSGSPSMRQALAASKHTSDEVLNRLAGDRDRATHHAALRRITDTSILEERYTNGANCCKSAVVRNVNLGVTELTDALQSKVDDLVLRAYVNPATPVDARRALPITRVEELVVVGEPLGDTVVRSHEAMLNNQYLLEDIGSLSTPLLRAAAAIPTLSREHYEQLGKARWTKFVGRHPLNHHQAGAVGLTAKQLLALNSPAADLWLVEDHLTSPTTAAKLLNRIDYDLEPHVLSRLLDRFGVEVIPSGVHQNLAQTRIKSTAWSNPLGGFYNIVRKAKHDQHIQALATAVKSMPDDQQCWETFLALLPGWESPLSDLSAAARGL